MNLILTLGLVVAMGASGVISVISCEDGSGTRGAFVELLGIEQKNDAGEKIDYTTLKSTWTYRPSNYLPNLLQDLTENRQDARTIAGFCILLPLPVFYKILHM